MSGSIVTKELSAPVEGWDTREALADMPEKRAVILDNWFPSTDRLNIRPGYAAHVTGIGAAVETLMEYVPLTGTSKLFAAADDSIYDVTSAGAVGSAEVSSLANARWQYVNFGTAGGQFLLCVNGADDPLNYNGSAWSTSPAITGPTAANLVWVNAHQRRLWAGEKDSLTAWYLPVNTIGGAASSFSFAGLAKRGGYLMAMGTWSRDGGDGQDDVAAFLTSEGECLVYQGTDPASAATWNLAGVFQLGKPLGRRCFVKAGADLLIITEEGVVPLASILSIDRSQSERVALTSQVNKAFNDYVRSYGSLFGWDALIYPRRTMLLFNVPTSSATADQIVFNTITRAPCRFTSIPAICWGMRGNDPYFGSSNGTVYKFDGDVTSDAGTNINTDAMQAFSRFGTQLSKRFTLARPVFEANTIPAIAVEMNVNYERRPPESVPTSLAGNGGLWDTAVWDVDVWGGDADIYNGWIGITGVGKTGALRIRTASTALTAAWIATEFQYVPSGTMK
jgi:hypothetical protein